MQVQTAKASIPHYKNGEVIGILKIPEVGIQFPIYQGTAGKELSKGAGHYSNTAVSGQNDQIVIPAHNTTEFGKIGKLKKGDRIQIQTKYGKFRYKVKSSKIIDDHQLSLIHSTFPHEELVLFTCYPFKALWKTNRRYVVIAYKVDQSFWQ